MRRLQHLKYRNRLTDWLLIVTLFSGLFLQWGGFGDSDYQQPTIRIESVATVRQTTARRSVVFKSRRISSVKKVTFVKRFLVKVNVLLEFNRLEKTKFIAFSKPLIDQKTAAKFLQNKTIPQSSDEELVTFYRG
jgi:hypothetical protein